MFDAYVRALVPGGSATELLEQCVTKPRRHEWLGAASRCFNLCMHSCILVARGDDTEAVAFVRFSALGPWERLSLKSTKERHVAGSNRQGQGVDCRAPREHSAHRPRCLLGGQGVTPPPPRNSPHVQVAICAPRLARKEGLGTPSPDSTQAPASLTSLVVSRSA
jgi:hypothetical protein